MNTLDRRSLMNLDNKKVTPFLLWGVFLFAFILGPVRQLNGLDLIAGDLGDARLVNYFLENIYQFLSGTSSSLVHLNFFSFFPYVLGFGDNLFGSAPVYLVFRQFTGESDTAFQLWFYVSYAVNYFAAYWALRLLGIRALGAIFGAVIFAFALPITAKMLHAQLSYRFCVPLAIAYFYLFLERGRIQLFLCFVAWLVWAFYCSIYIGVFTAFFAAVMLIVFVIVALYKKINLIDIYLNAWKNTSPQKWIFYGVIFLLLIGAMGALMYPYIKVSNLYGFKRNYAEILSMLPTFKSYLLADLSFFWGKYSAMLGGIPMRHEEQLFIGAVPLILIGTSLFIANAKQKITYITFAGALILTIVFTLKFGRDFSLWQYFAQAPLLSSLRVMSRIIIVLLFPIAYLCSFSIDRLDEKNDLRSKFLICLLLFGLLGECLLSNGYVALPKEEWRSRLASEELRLPKDIPPNAILFFAQRSEAAHIDELDAMWVSMAHSLPTLNGYSGNFPPGYNYNFGSSCLELPIRIMSYLNFIKRLDSANYGELMHRVIPIGFNDCQAAWFNVDPQISISTTPYSADAFKNLSITVQKVENFGSYWRLSVDILNGGDEPISGFSGTGNPISLSYRLLDKAENPVSNWDPRLPLWADIPANGALHFVFNVPKNIPVSSFIEFSLVQEGIFWGHYLGVSPRRVFLAN